MVDCWVEPTVHQSSLSFMPLGFTRSASVHPLLAPLVEVEVKLDTSFRPVNPLLQIEIYVKGLGRLGLKLGIDPLTGTPIVVEVPAADGEVELARPGAVELGDRLLIVGSRVFEDFQDLDEDRNGVLTKSEIKAAMLRLGCAADALIPSALLDRLGDANAAVADARHGAGSGASLDASIDAGATAAGDDSTGVPLEEFKAAMTDAVAQDLADQLGREPRPLRLVFLRYGASAGAAARGAPAMEASTPTQAMQEASIASGVDKSSRVGPPSSLLSAPVLAAAEATGVPS